MWVWAVWGWFGGFFFVFVVFPHLRRGLVLLLIFKRFFLVVVFLPFCLFFFFGAWRYQIVCTIGAICLAP
jgi:hypothetical protein